MPGDELKVDGRYTAPAQPNAPPHTAVLIRPGGVGPWQILVEPYLPNRKTDPWTEMSNCCDADGRASATPAAIPLLEGDYWVLGDNRNFSADSRSFGIVAAEEIIGKVLYRERGGATTWIYAAAPLLLPIG